MDFINCRVIIVCYQVVNVIDILQTVCNFPIIKVADVTIDRLVTITIDIAKMIQGVPDDGTNNPIISKQVEWKNNTKWSKLNSLMHTQKMAMINNH